MTPDEVGVSSFQFFLSRLPLEDEAANRRAIGNRVLQNVLGLHPLCGPVSETSVHPIPQRRLKTDLKRSGADFFQQDSSHGLLARAESQMPNAHMAFILSTLSAPH